MLVKYSKSLQLNPEWGKAERAGRREPSHSHHLGGSRAGAYKHWPLQLCNTGCKTVVWLWPFPPIRLLMELSLCLSKYLK